FFPKTSISLPESLTASLFDLSFTHSIPHYPFAALGSTTPPPASSAATSPRPARSRLPPPGAPSLASVQSVSPAPRCTSPGSAAAPVAVASSASPGSIPAPRSDAPAPAAPPPDIASTAASPADSSHPSAPPLPPTSSRLRLPAQAPPLASTLV